MNQNTAFSLREYKNPRTGKKFFVVSMNRHHTNYWRYCSEICEHFDPHNNRRFKGKDMWKFSTKDMAERLMMFAILHWSTR